MISTLFTFGQLGRLSNYFICLPQVAFMRPPKRRNPVLGCIHRLLNRTLSLLFGDNRVGFELESRTNTVNTFSLIGYLGIEWVGISTGWSQLIVSVSVFRNYVFGMTALFLVVSWHEGSWVELLWIYSTAYTQV